MPFRACGHGKKFRKSANETKISDILIHWLYKVRGGALKVSKLSGIQKIGLLYFKILYRLP